MTASTAQFCRFHPATETRLTCTECDAPICPKCMVPCEVGIKCRACVKALGVPLPGAVILKASAWSMAAGYGFGYVQPYVSGFSIIGFILTYFLGHWAGMAVRRLVGYRVGNALGWVVLVSAFAGMLLGPFQQVVWQFLAVLQTSGDINRIGGSPDMGSVLFLRAVLPACLFLVGLRTPFRS